MKKQQLEVEDDLDFLLFGLVSADKASKLAYFLNQIHPFQFERVADLKLPDFNPNSNISFSKFVYMDEENHLDFSLVANREFGWNFYQDLKQFDYLMIVRGGLEFFDTSRFIKECRSLGGVQLIAQIDNNKLKSKLSWIL